MSNQNYRGGGVALLQLSLSRKPPEQDYFPQDTPLTTLT